MKRLVRIIALSLAIGLVYYLFPTSISNNQWNKLMEASKEPEFKHGSYAVLIDYSRPVYKKRLWLIELSSKKILLNCHVSHAKNSGFFKANTYSNIPGSELSCTGMFTTLNKYESQYGKGIYKIGLRIKGLDTNNTNTFKRNIVFHSSFPWWSKGCFMTSQQNNKFIIDKLGTASLVLVLP